MPESEQIVQRIVIKDEISPGVVKITKVLEKLDAAGKKVTQTSTMMTTSVEKLNGVLQQTTGASGEAAASLKGMVAEMSGGAITVGGLTVAMVGVHAIMGAFKSIVGEVKDAVVDLWDIFKQGKQAEQVFTLRYGEEGIAVLERIKAAAEASGVTMEQSTNVAMKMAEAFKYGTTAEELTKVLLDLKAASPTLELDKMTTSMEKLAQKTYVGKQSMMLFNRQFGANGGIQVGAKEIAAVTGEAMSTVIQHMKKGTVKATDYVKALRMVAEQQAGTSQAGVAAIQKANVTLESQINIIESRWKEFKRKLAKSIFDSPALLQGVKGLIAGFDKLTQNPKVVQFFDTVGKAIGNNLLDRISRLGDVMEVVEKVIVKLIDAWNWLHSGSKAANATMKAIELTFKGIMYAVIGVAAVIAALAVGIEVLLAPFQAITLAAFALIGAIVRGVISLPGMIKDAWSGLVIWVENLGTRISTAFQNAIAPALEVFKTLGLDKIGVEMMTGLAQGIDSASKFVEDAVLNVANKAVSTFKSALGIHSPSIVMQGYGENVSQGAAVGIAKGTPEVDNAMDKMTKSAVSSVRPAEAAVGIAKGAPEVDNAMDKMTKSAVSSVRPAEAAAAGAGAAKTINFEQTINFSGGQGGEKGQSKEEIVGMVRKATLDVLRSEQSMILLQG